MTSLRSVCRLNDCCAQLGLEARTFGSALEFLEANGLTRRAAWSSMFGFRRLSGLDLQAELAARKIALPIIFVTGHGDIPMSVRAMKAGAVEFLTKPYREQELLEAIQRAIDQDGITRQHSAELRALQERYALLTPREREVFPRVTSGLLNKQIAAELGASEKTIKVHRGQVMQKMEARIIGRPDSHGGETRPSFQLIPALWDQGPIDTPPYRGTFNRVRQVKQMSQLLSGAQQPREAGTGTKLQLTVIRGPEVES